jgi:hypothetical protein
MLKAGLFRAHEIIFDPVGEKISEIVSGVVVPEIVDVVVSQDSFAHQTFDLSFHYVLLLLFLGSRCMFRGIR